jgi:type I restriction enzyme, R subunit
MPLTESVVEEAALEWFAALGYTVLYGETIAPDQPAAERVSYADVVLVGRLSAALHRLNPHIPDDALEYVVSRILRNEYPSLVENNHNFHRYLTEGFPAEYLGNDGRIIHDTAYLIDFDNPANNDWLAVNQFTVIENGFNRRPDVVVFVNGLPLAVLELKNAADENATLHHAFSQLQTYKAQIAAVFTYNALLVISDGVEARAGTLTADWERFMPWRTIEGDDLAPRGWLGLEVLIKGMFERKRFLDLIRYFTVFEVSDTEIVKKIAGYHQFHAVNKAVGSTLDATEREGRVGVIWHTQGSGKSLTMVFYAGKLIQRPAMANPTLVVITDRGDLDDQLFGTFSRCHELLRQTPIQAESRDHLKELLQVASGGVVFTTIQKFLPSPGERYPMLSERDNIVVIADEAHRSQYDFIDGFARNMRDALPNARFIAFTGTPLEKADRNTITVFGDYIDVYDIQQAVEDGATVPIYYEARWAKLAFNEAQRPQIDPDFEEATEGEEIERKERLKSKWSRLEAVIGAEARIQLLARDIVEHFEQRRSGMDGKGMIVCMSRRICIDLYKAIIALRPEWHSDEDKEGFIKVIMTGSASDLLEWQPHIRNKPRRDALAEEFKKPGSDIKLVIVRDMWLTGFDAPSLHTMYVDKPMRGHGLMQAIARVNRVFGPKLGGLVVDYLGLADQLRDALAEYTEGDRQQTGIPESEAIALMLKKYQAVAAQFQGFDYSHIAGKPAAQLAALPAAMDFILSRPDGKREYVQAVTELSKAFALVVTTAEAYQVRDEVGFFQAVRAVIVKHTTLDGRSPQEYDQAVSQIVGSAIASDGVVDIFTAMGIQQPEISILSDEFLSSIRNLPHKNLALELLHKLLNDEIKSMSRRNVVQARSFSTLLDQAIRQYQNRTAETVGIIAALIDLARQMRDAQGRGEDLGLTLEELAFYDALDAQDSAVQVLGDEALRTLAHEIVKSIRQNVSIDWTKKSSVRARLRTTVKRVLRQYGYPPEKLDRATVIILEQAEVIARDWAA